MPDGIQPGSTTGLNDSTDRTKQRWMIRNHLQVSSSGPTGINTPPDKHPILTWNFVNPANHFSCGIVQVAGFSEASVAGPPRAERERPPGSLDLIRL